MSDQVHNPIQVKFFEHLKNTLGANVSIQDAIADLLDVKKDGAYRRMRGETVLSFDEGFTICDHFKIPIETFTGKNWNSVIN